MKKICFGVILFLIILLCENVQAYNEYNIGEIVKYQDEEYYVIKKSESNENYVTALKKTRLTADEINSTNSDYVSQNGEYPYYKSNKCIEVYSPNFYRDYSGCTNRYDESNVKDVIDEWSLKYSDVLVKIDGYKARLMSENDLYNLGYMIYFNTGNLFINDDGNNLYSWIFDDYEYWGMNYIESDDNVKEAIVLFQYDMHVTNLIYNLSYVRPVVNFDKCKAFNDCSAETDINIEKIKAYKKYTFGDKVTYNGEDYYVLIDSDVNKDYVALIKAKPLKTNVVAYYYQGEIKDINGYGAIPFSGLYENSEVKKIVDKWANDEFGDGLYEYNGYKARIPSIDDLIDYLFYDPLQYGHTTFSYKSGSDTPCWSTVDVESYWTMSNYEDSNYVWTIVNQDYQGCVARAFYGSRGYYKSAIRPIVYVKKCYLDSDSAACSQCNTQNKTTSLVKKYTSYKKNDKIFYHNDKYIIARDSDETMQYVTLIRNKPFTASELNQYGIDKNGNSVINKFPYINSNETSPVNTYKEIQINEPIDNENNWNAKIRYYVVTPGKAYEYTNGYGGMQFYSNEQCGYVYGKFLYLGCNKKYADSDIKIVIDNWVKDKGFSNELVAINGNSSRLINKDEMKSVENYNYSDMMYYWIYNDDFFEGGKNGYLKYMYESNVYFDNEYFNWNVSYSSGFKYYLNSLYPNDVTTIMGVVYPVIHVNKQYLEDGAEIENYDLESCFEDTNVDENVEIVETANTLKKVSLIAILIGSLSIILGLYLYITINRKLKKINNRKQ